jgi:hypothetical protein
MAAYDEAHPASGYYVLPLTWNVGGLVDEKAFTQAVEAICERYPVLLAGIRRDGDSWVQNVLPFERVPVQFHDVRGLSEGEIEGFLEASYQEFCRLPFRLAEQPPLRIRIIQLAEAFIVLGAFHQAGCDLESMAVFTAEFWLLYEAFAAGRVPELPASAVPFADYATQLAASSTEPDAGNLRFWTDRLADAPLRCPIPVDHPEGLANPGGPTAYFKIGGRATALAAHAIATEQRCSEHAVLLAALALVLTRRSGGTSLVVSSPISLRRSARLLQMFGPMTDTVWLRIDVGGPTVRDNVGPAFKSILGALSNPVPMDTVVQHVAPAAATDLSVAPNIQVQYFPPERVANPGWVSSSVKVREVLPVYLLTGPLQSPFWLDLAIAGEQSQPDTDFTLSYRTDLFEPETARQIAREIEAGILAQAQAQAQAQAPDQAQAPVQVQPTLTT